MSEFTSSAELSITVPNSELRQVRQQIESEVGTTEIGVTDGGSMSAQAARGGVGGGGRARRRARRSYRMEIERTNYLEDAVVYLESIDDKVGEGGGGGGVFDDMVGALLETGGDAAIELGDTAIEIATDAAATALGNAVADAVSSSELDVAEPSWTPLAVEDPGTVEVTKPGWAPLGVEDPGAVDVTEPGWTPLAVEDPGTVEVTKPGWAPLGVEDPGAVDVTEPGWTPLAVEDPGELSVEDPTVDVTVSVATSSENAGKSAEGKTDDGGFGGGFRFGKSFSGEGELATADGGDTGFRVGGQNWGINLGTGRFSGAYQRPQQSRRSATGSRRSRRPQVRDVSVSTQTDTTVTVDPSGLRSLRDDIIGAFDDSIADTRDDLETQIDELESELESLREEITGRR